MTKILKCRTPNGWVAEEHVRNSGSRQGEKYFSYKRISDNKRCRSLKEVRKISNNFIHPKKPLSTVLNEIKDSFALSNKNIIIMSILSIFATASICKISFSISNEIATSNNPSLILFIGSYIVFSTYYTLDHFIKKISKSYNDCNQDDKTYVLSNLIKSGALLLYSPQALNLLYNTIIYNFWDIHRIRNFCILYAIPDFVSLLVVKKMSRSTVIHHVLVCILATYSFFTNFDEDSVDRLIIIYGIFSVLSYLVNFLLATRFLDFNNIISAILSILAGGIYILCCTVNWTWQIVKITKIIYNRIDYFAYLYILIITALIVDDVILIKWLLYNIKRKLNIIKKN
tara:strand:- start:222 stop:1247 length:1026 start_codon:yes stop_codon:yes gene_type:complete